MKKSNIPLHIRYGDGSRYIGEQLQGEPHGEGILTYANGRYYTGGFQHARFHGKGVLFDPIDLHR